MAMAIDGSAGGQFSHTNTGTVTLTTTQAKDVIILAYYHQDKVNQPVTRAVINTVASANLTWNKRKQFLFDTGTNTNEQDIEIWWAYAAAALTSEVITITLNSSIDDAAYQAFGVSGSLTPQSPWDGDPSLAGANNSGLNVTSIAVAGVSTEAITNMIIGVWGDTSNANATIPAGTTQVRAPQDNGGGTFFAFMGSFFQVNS